MPSLYLQVVLWQLLSVKFELGGCILLDKGIQDGWSLFLGLTVCVSYLVSQKIPLILLEYYCWGWPFLIPAGLLLVYMRCSNILHDGLMLPDRGLGC